MDALGKLLGTREPNVPICYRLWRPLRFSRFHQTSACIHKSTDANHEPVVSYLNPHYGGVVTTVHLLTFIMLLLFL